MTTIQSSEYIYESPDNGNTVYRRKIGDDERELYIQKEPDLFTYAEIQEIKELSKTNSSLKKALDNLLVIYYTIKDDTKT
jgi:hypothetical protein